MKIELRGRYNINNWQKLLKYAKFEFGHRNIEKMLNCILSISIKSFSRLYNYYLIIQLMKSRLNWRPEEDKLLKQLRDEQKLTSWLDISTRLNVQFSTNNRTPKQCRERYYNSARFGNQFEDSKVWNKDDDIMLCQLYLRNGPKWTSFLKYFTSKSQNTIKNRFHCCLRKLARKMRDFEEKPVDVGRKYQMLLTTLEIVDRIERENQSINGKKLNQNSNLSLLRKNILELSLKNNNIQQHQIQNVLTQIHKANSHYRCLGIFKAKNKRNWELNKKRFEYIMTLDDHQTIDAGQSTSDSESSEQSVNQNISQFILSNPYSSLPSNQIIDEFDFPCQININYKSNFEINQNLEDQVNQILGLQCFPELQKTLSFYF